MTRPYHLIATLRDDLAEVEGLREMPHWRRAEGLRLRDLSRRFRAIEQRAGGSVHSGRAFTAKYRQRLRDPFSDMIEPSPQEVASGLDRVLRVTCRDRSSAQALARALAAYGVIESVHPVMPEALDRYRGPSFDPITSQLPGSWAIRAIRGDDALDLEPGRSDVLVAVLDSGIDGKHREFEGRVAGGYDFVHMPGETPAEIRGVGAARRGRRRSVRDESGTGMVGDYMDRDADWMDDTGHGTHVAGLIGGKGVRMSPGMGGACSLLAVRVLASTLEGGRRVGVGTISDIDDGWKYAVDEGADVVNASLGVSGFGPGIPHQRLVRYARLHDVVVVAASGNHGGDSPLFPAAIPGVITVGAIDELGRVAAFSSWGGHVDVVAPGTAIYSADLDNGYRYRDGTSHAAPLVAGVAALIVARARRAGLKIRERTVRRILRDTADRVGARMIDPHAGAGILNARDALVMASELVRTHHRRRWSNTDDEFEARRIAA